MKHFFYKSFSVFLHLFLAQMFQNKHILFQVLIFPFCVSQKLVFFSACQPTVTTPKKEMLLYVFLSYFKTSDDWTYFKKSRENLSLHWQKKEECSLLKCCYLNVILHFAVSSLKEVHLRKIMDRPMHKALSKVCPP